MEKSLTLYHGSKRIVRTPQFGLGRKTNDFGLGFYCTETEALAKEWAVSYLDDGFCNRYSLDARYLRILHLNSSEYSILNWIAVLVEHRLFSMANPPARKARQYLIDHFGVNVNAYDVVIGYRADDSYYDYADAFLNNSITVDQLSLAMKLGKLGEQVVIKSEEAFSLLKFERFKPVDKNQYYIKRKARIDDANADYLRILEGHSDGLFIQDIIRGGIENGDPRIPRNIAP